MAAIPLLSVTDGNYIASSGLTLRADTQEEAVANTAITPALKRLEEMGKQHFVKVAFRLSMI